MFSSCVLIAAHKDAYEKDKYQTTNQIYVKKYLVTHFNLSPFSLEVEVHCTHDVIAYVNDMQRLQ